MTALSLGFGIGLGALNTSAADVTRCHEGCLVARSFPSLPAPPGCPCQRYSPTHIDMSAAVGYPVVDPRSILADKILYVHLILAVSRSCEAHARPGRLRLLPVRWEVQVRRARAEAEVQRSVWRELVAAIKARVLPTLGSTAPHACLKKCAHGRDACSRTDENHWHIVGGQVESWRKNCVGNAGSLISAIVRLPLAYLLGALLATRSTVPRAES